MSLHVTKWAGTGALAVGALLGGCADLEPTDERSLPIVHGEPDYGDPAAVYLGFGDGSGGGWACTGTLISPHVVLTAQHCINSFRDGSAFFGFDPGGSGTRIALVGSREHPSADIAMVALASAGPATPVPVNGRDLGPHVGIDIRIIGYGGRGPDGDGGQKYHGRTKLHEVQSDQIITGYDGPSHLCFGDSGGPNMITFGGVEYVAAVNSWIGAPCGEPPNGSYRTDPHHTWIMDYVRDVEGGGPDPDPDPDPDPSPGQRLVARHSGSCLDVSGSGTADGANIQQWSCNGTSAQSFRIEDAPGGGKRLINTNSGKCVDVAGSGTSNGTDIRQWSCNGTAAQAFLVEDRGGGYVRLRNRNSNKCAQVQGTGDGADVVQWTCGSGRNQQWRIE